MSILIVECAHLKMSRNAARTKSRDVTGRAQKGHFMRQRHQVLVKELLQDCREDPERRLGRMEEISLAHAKRNVIGVTQGARFGMGPETPLRPSHKTCTASSVPRNTHLTSEASSSGKGKGTQVNRSKILEALDINDREWRVLLLAYASVNEHTSGRLKVHNGPPHSHAESRRTLFRFTSVWVAKTVGKNWLYQQYVAEEKSNSSELRRCSVH